MHKPLRIKSVINFIVLVLCAEAAWGATVSIPKISGQPGDTLTVPMVVDNATGIAGVELLVTYDPAILTATGAERTSLTSGFELKHAIEQEQGKIALTMARSTSIATGRGVLVNVLFQVNADAPPGATSPLTLTKVSLYDEKTQPISAVVRDGLFTVTGPTLVSGKVSGVWTKAGSPYIVTGDITVVAGRSLTIEPGVEVRFDGPYTFLVNGKLQAVGAEADTIRFTRHQEAEGAVWNGIVFYEADDASRMEYCRIEYSQGRTDSYPNGGGLLIENGSLTMAHSVLSHNATYGYGGGIAIINASLRIRDSVISHNSAEGEGGGISITEGSTAEIVGSTIQNNTTGNVGGGIYIGDNSSATIMDNTITENTSTTDWGGGIGARYGASFTIRNNTIAGNTAVEGGGISLYEQCSGTITSNRIVDNTGREGGGGMMSYGSTPRIRDNTISNNAGGGIHISEGDFVEIVGNTIQKNTTNDVGGGIFITGNPSVIVAGNAIVGNAAEGWGGGIGMLYGSLFTVSGNIIAGNRAMDGGGISFYEECAGTITNNTIVDNTAKESGGGIRSYGSDVTVRNSILRDNAAGDGPEVYIDASSTGVITYSNVAGGQKAIAKDAESKVIYENNLDADPLFVDPAKRDVHLQAGSPCIDAGDPNPFFNEPDNSRCDMGAYGGGGLVVNVTEYDVGIVALDHSKTVDFKITNLRGADVVISGLERSDEIHFSISESPPITIGTHQQRTIPVTFSPQAMGVFSATLTVTSDDFYGATSADIVFQGEGVSRAVSGDVSGVWTKAESPYVVIGDIVVPKWNTLSIEPGVEVRFDGRYTFKVNGKLEAVGTEADTIVFTRHRETGHWGGMIFYKADSASRLEYGRIEYAEATGEYPKRGGGLLIEDCSPTVTHSVITDNRAEEGGGGMAIINASPRITHSIISNNSAGSWGGGIYVRGLSPDITDNKVVNNIAGRGGGIYVEGDASSPVIADNTITGNEVTATYDYGGGIAVADSSSPTIRGNRIVNNTMGEGGHGGGLCFLNHSSGIIEQNVITGNSGDVAGGIYVEDASLPITMNGNTISDNVGTGIYLIRSSSVSNRIRDNTVSNNSGGGMDIEEGSAAEIVGNRIEKNVTHAVGGGIFIGDHSSATIAENTIRANTSTDDWGGGIGVIASSAIIQRNLIVDNEAYDGGGVSFYQECSGTLTNNTMVRNRARNVGGGLRSDASELTVKNTILGNSSPDDSEIYLDSGSTCTITYSNVAGGEDVIVWEPENDTLVYENNMNVNPLFVDLAGGDYHLQAGSPCIDAGDPESPPDPDGTRADIGVFYFDQSGVERVPGLSLSESSHDFGEVRVDSSSDWPLTVSNVGTADLSVTSIISDHSAFTVDSTFFTVPPKGSQDVGVTFRPTAAGAVSGTLTIASNDPKHLEVKVVLQGTGTTKAVPVTFPDPNLEAAIRSALNKPEGPITEEDLAGLTTLDASERRISDLRGIEHCVNLQKLNLDGNQISDLSPLSTLTSLRELDLGSNQIRDTSPLSRLINLQWLELSNNQIGNISPLGNLTRLAGLELADNQISDLSPLSTLTNLWELDLAGNLISAIRPLSSLTKLEILDLQGNQIGDINPLSKLADMMSLLYLDGNRISDIAPLSKFTKIGNITFEETPERVPKRKGIAVHLGLSNNQISDISPLVDNPGIREGDGVDLRGNPLSQKSIGSLQTLRTRGVNVLWEVLPSPMLTPSTDQITFGPVQVGSHRDTTLFLSNRGTADLQITRVVLTSGEALELLQDLRGSSIAPNDSVSLGVRFHPTTMGAFQDTIQVTSNDPKSPHRVSLAGQGIQQNISLSTPGHSFGQVQLGSFAEWTLVISNEGTAPLSLEGITLEKGAVFSIGAVPLPQTLQPQEELSVAITFTPSSTGDASDVLTIQSDDPDEGILTVRLSGIGTALPVPDIALSKDQHNFGEIQRETSSTWTLTIYNVGTANLIVSEMATEPPFTLNPTSGTIPPGDSLHVTITFAPDEAKVYSDTLTIRSNDPDRPTIAISLSGTGSPVPIPNIALSENQHDFGEIQADTTSAWTLTIYNVGTANLVLSDIATHVPFASDPTSGTIPPGDSLSVVVTFRPAEVQTYTDSLTIRSNDPDEPVRIIVLTGTGTPIPEPNIVLSASSHDFGEVVIQSTDTWILTLRNEGTADLTVFELAVEAPFELTPTSGIIPPGDSLYVELTFRPTDVGAYEGNLTVQSDDPDEGFLTLHLKGTGTPVPAAHIVLSKNQYDFGDVQTDASSTWTFAIYNVGTANLIVSEMATEPPFTLNPTSGTIPPGDSLEVTITFAPDEVKAYSGTLIITSNDPDRATTTIALSGTGMPIPAPDIKLSEDQHDFQNVRMGTVSTWTLTIYNVGTADLMLSDIATHPPFASDPTSGTILPGDSLSVGVTFRPEEAQAHTDSLTIRSNDPDEPVRIINLTGTGTPIPEPNIALSASSHDFGEVIVQSTGTWSLTLFNIGTADLTVSDIATESPFTSDPTSGTIPPTDSLHVEITFRPTDVDTYERALTIQSNDPDEGILTIRLMGTGKPVPEPHLTLSEGTHDFGTVDIGTRSTWTLTLRNDGDADLIVTDILSPDESPFDVILPTLPYTLPPSEDIQVTVHFIPSVHGPSEGELTIRSNDPKGDVQIPLTGAGRDADPPRLVHTPSSFASEGQTIPITATCSDNVGITTAYLFYREGSTVRYDSTAMVSSGDDTYTASIPASAVGAQGVEYYLAVSDGVHRSTWGPQHLAVRLTGLSNPNVQPSGSEQTAYRMISVPMVLDDPLPSAVFPDDLGPYDPTQWRLFRYTHGAWSEFPDITEALTPGRAFWLIAKEAGKRIDVGSGTSTPTESDFQIPLQPGWNDIGVPFNFPVDWDDIQLEGEVDLNGPYGYEGAWTDPETTTQLHPWKGYALYNLSDQSATLRVPPIQAGTRTKAVPRTSTKPLWSIRILTQCDQAKDNINTIGYLPDASETWDRYDLLEPYPVGSYVSLYVDHTDWPRYPGRYTADVRPCIDEGATYLLYVETNIPDAPVHLTFQGLSSVPEHYHLTLRDHTTGASLDLRTQSTYTIPSEGRPLSRRISLLIGTNTYQAQQLHAIPEDVRLLPNYPNPFNAHTTLTYQIPVDGFVDLSIYTPIGQRIRTLMALPQQTGVHTTVWDGTDHNGTSMASGIYFAVLRVGPHQSVQKICLIR